MVGKSPEGVVVAESQSILSPSLRLVWLSLISAETCMFTTPTPTREASVTLTVRPVKLSVPSVTVAIEKATPEALKPSPLVVSTDDRSPLNAPPEPTNRLAPDTENDRTSALLSVPDVPRLVLPVFTSAVALSRVRLDATATTVPLPIFSEAEPSACSCIALLIVTSAR